MSESGDVRYCHFVSDLHLQSRRSYGDALLEPIQQAASESHTLVLGGDIFDFKWSTRPSPDAAVQDALDWVEGLVSQFPHCQFLYVVGNHDHNREFLEGLEQFESQHTNFDWHPFAIRLDDTVFLHGDVTHGYANQEELAVARERWMDEKPKAAYWHMLYEVAIAARLHRAASRLANRKALIVDRILQWLNSTGHGLEHGLRRVYFGHTHAPLDGFERQGVRFFNPGGAIRGMECRVMKVEASERTVSPHERAASEPDSDEPADESQS